VIKRGRDYIPVEVKTGLATKGAHRKQLQIYIYLLKARHGYLVYRNRVERVERDDSAVMILEEIRRILSGDGREIGRECERCMFKAICKNVL
jgi:CRISPR-associated exonuclease Cas4